MYDNLITTGKPLKQTYGMEVIGYFKDQADIENSPKQSFGDVKPGDINIKMLMVTILLMRMIKLL